MNWAMQTRQSTSHGFTWWPCAGVRMTASLMTAHPSEALRVHAVIVSTVTEMRLYHLRVTVERIEGRSSAGSRSATTSR